MQLTKHMHAAHKHTHTGHHTHTHLWSFSCVLAVFVLPGLVYQPPLPTGQLRAVRTNDRSLAGCGRYIDALKQLAATYWGFARHPGWALVPEQPVRVRGTQTDKKIVYCSTQTQ